MTESEQHHADAGPAQSRMDAERAGDSQADTWALLVVFASAILFAVHFISSGRFI